MATTDHRTSSHQQKKLRSPNGQALVEGVVALALIVAVTVGATLLLTNLGLSLFFKEKLAFCGNQAAQFALSIKTNPELQTQTTTFVRELLPKLGITPNELSVTVDTNATVAGRPAVAVTIRNACTLVGDGSIIPARVLLTDTAAAVMSGTSGSGTTSATGFLQVPEWAGSGRSLLVPIAGKTPGDGSSLQKPVFLLRLGGGGPLQIPGGAFGDFSSLPEASP